MTSPTSAPAATSARAAPSHVPSGHRCPAAMRDALGHEPGSHEVHLWQASLDQPASQVQRLLRVCSAEERHRADRLRSAQRGRDLLVGRAILRSVLGGYLGADARDVRLATTTGGKPVVDAPPYDLRFNAAHSGRLAVYALCRGREVGVDLETSARDLDVSAVARRLLAPGEVEAVQSVPAEHRRRAFLRVWTRKEALLKARGTGLRAVLHESDVTVAGRHGDRPAGKRSGRDGHRDQGQGWWLTGVDMPQPYVAALAVESGPAPLRRHHWHAACCPHAGRVDQHPRR